MAPPRTAAHPPIVAQQNDDSCWAAALESWLGAVNDPARKRSQTELLKLFSGSDKSFDCGVFRQFATSVGMSSVWLADPGEFGQRVPELLRTSVLFVSYHCESTSPWYHDVVLYGLKTDKLGVTGYQVMNPSYRRVPFSCEVLRQGYQTWQLGYFFPVSPDDEVLVGWKDKGPGKLY